MFIHPSWIIPIPFSMRWCYKICICQCYLPVRVKMANSVIPGVFSATREIPISRYIRYGHKAESYRISPKKRACLNICAPWLLTLTGHISGTTEPIWFMFLAHEVKVLQGPHGEFHWNQTWVTGRFMSAPGAFIRRYTVWYSPACSPGAISTRPTRALTTFCHLGVISGCDHRGYMIWPPDHRFSVF